MKTNTECKAGLSPLLGGGIALIKSGRSAARLVPATPETASAPHRKLLKPMSRQSFNSLFGRSPKICFNDLP